MLLQPNQWSCLPTAVAMCTDYTLKEIFDYLGHDGSEIVSNDPEPKCRRGFTVEEIVDFLMYKAFRPVYIQAEIVHENGCEHKYTTRNYTSNIERLNNYLCEPCVLLGTPKGTDLEHAVYWDGKQIQDPCGATYEISEFSLIGILLMI